MGWVCWVCGGGVCWGWCTFLVGCQLLGLLYRYVSAALSSTGTATPPSQPAGWPPRRAATSRPTTAACRAVCPALFAFPGFAPRAINAFAAAPWSPIEDCCTEDEALDALASAAVREAAALRESMPPLALGGARVWEAGVAGSD